MFLSVSPEVPNGVAVPAFGGGLGEHAGALGIVLMSGGVSVVPSGSAGPHRVDACSHPPVKNQAWRH